MIRPEFAHYYGDWIWRPELTDWVKSLLLFFDGIAIGVPESRFEQRIESDPVLAQPLTELGLLRNYWPETYKQMEEKSRVDLGLERLVRELDELYKQASQEDFNSSLARLTESLSPELKERLNAIGTRFILAKQRFGGDELSRANTLAVAQVSMSLVQYVTDVAIQPVIDDENAAGYVAMILNTHSQSHAQIVNSDIRHVGIDLKAIPLDEVLDFRRQHGSEYRAYSQDVRQFVLHISLLPEAERPSAISARHAELDDRAEELRRIGRSAFKRQVVSFGFGLAGAAWTLVHGDPYGALFATGATAAGLTAPTPGSMGAAYSYILMAKTGLAR